MRTSRSIPTLLLGASLALAACDDGATGPTESRMSAEEATLLAAEFDLLGEAVIGGFTMSFSSEAGGALADEVPINVEFTRTAACPKGGSVSVAGKTTGSRDRDSRTVVLETNSTKTQNDCAFAGRGGATITVDGNPNIAIKANSKTVNGKPAGLQTLTQKGAFTWTRSTGGEGSCTVDLAAEWNPETRTHTLKGTFCNRQVNTTRTRG